MHESDNILEIQEPMTDLYVGVEFFIDPSMGDPWWQEFVTFATTRGALTRQLNSHYTHRLNTAEAYQLTRTGMAEQLKLVAYHIQVPARLLDTGKKDPDSYTWRSNDSYAQLQHIESWATRTLHFHGLTQQIEAYSDARGGTWRSEYREGLEKARSKITDPVGKLLSMEHIYPRELTAAERYAELDETAVCVMCNL